MPPECHPKRSVASGWRRRLNTAADEWSRGGDRAELRRVLLALCSTWTSSKPGGPARRAHGMLARMTQRHRRGLEHAIPIPHFEDLAIAAGRSHAELEHEPRLLLAIKLFELKRVSTGRAAAIAGLNELAFLDELAKLGVAAIDFAPAEVEHEFCDA
jgi:predicted HTH domain antitoxin